jgi:hypothetical protein
MKSPRIPVENNSGNLMSLWMAWSICPFFARDKIKQVLGLVDNEWTIYYYVLCTAELLMHAGLFFISMPGLLGLRRFAFISCSWATLLVLVVEQQLKYWKASIYIYDLKIKNFILLSCRVNSRILNKINSFWSSNWNLTQD